LLKQGYRIVCVVRRTSTLTFDRILHIQNDLDIVQGDPNTYLCWIRKTTG